MRTNPRSNKVSPADNELDLLQQLIETPPAAQQAWKAPVMLRSKEEQRRHALRGYLLRNWFDNLLQHTERLLAVAALLVFGYWLFDGPMRDWLHTRSSALPASMVVAAQPKPTSVALVATLVLPVTEKQPTLHLITAPLPFTTPSSNDDDAFLAPQSDVRAPVMVGEPEPSHLQIPSIDLDTPVKQVFVVDGVWEVADYAAGYMHGTALPGEHGTMAIAGHAGLRGGVFRDLGALQIGDDVFVDAAGWRYQYRVGSTYSVWPTETDVLQPADHPTLVLITCTNWDTQRLIIQADLIGSKPIPGA